MGCDCKFQAKRKIRNRRRTPLSRYVYSIGDKGRVIELAPYREKRRLQSQKQEYESREIQTFLNELRLIERVGREEALDNLDEWASESASTIIERVGWLIDGTYGAGAYYAFQRNKNVRDIWFWLLQVVAALEWHVPKRYFRMWWDSLTTFQKSRYQSLVRKEMEKYNG